MPLLIPGDRLDVAERVVVDLHVVRRIVHEIALALPDIGAERTTRVLPGMAVPICSVSLTYCAFCMRVVIWSSVSSDALLG